ncbi:4-amino-4-deoxy-L-arabinose transferase [Opitutus sp. GAS368]|nr:4-amino-4-deoxy-L-arabinose transferase [Opitutus sp. GAS368]
MTPTRIQPWLPWMVAVVLAAGVFALRWPTFDFKVWNVDEAIHAAVARTLLDGGVLYRDAVDQRTPLTYYAVAGLFRIAGENNVRAMHALAAALIAATAFGLFLLGRAWRGPGAGLWAALLFAVLSSALFFPGDAYALDTEWFVAAFTTWAAWCFWRGSPAAAGGLLGLAFLSKQPALLDLGAPLAVLGYGALRERMRWSRPAALLAGFAAPVLLTVLYFAARGALVDLYFYTWRYNLQYYGPEIGTSDRVLSALKPFALLGAHYPLVLAALLGAAGFALFRVLQRRPEPAEQADNPRLLYLLAWAATSLAGAASGGRGYDHYFIQFLPAVCLAAALGLDGIGQWARAHRAKRWLLPAALVLFALVLAQLGRGVISFRAQASQPVDPSIRVAEFIKNRTSADEHIFVWGYHPDIYLFADRKPASRFVYASFLSGLIPWTNTAPDRDTAYAIVPGARETLLRELAAVQPAFIVDCSAGPNRSWQKYPLETFPALRDFIAVRYRVVEAGQFVPQGFRLYQLRRPDEPRETAPAAPDLPPAVRATLAIGTISQPLPPVQASAANGAGFSMVDGRAEYFAHAPSRLVYQVPAGVTKLRGGFGLRPGAYAATNPAPTDGAEFIIRWRPAGGSEQTLLRRLLRPREAAADRPVQSFRVDLPGGAGGELLLLIEPGPAGNPASDWTFWTDLLLETAP